MNKQEKNLYNYLKDPFFISSLKEWVYYIPIFNRIMIFPYDNVCGGNSREHGDYEIVFLGELWKQIQIGRLF